MGLRSHVSSYGMYGFAILSSRNFRQTMEFAVKYHEIATPLVTLRFAEEDGFARWDIHPLPHSAIDAHLYRFTVATQFGLHLSLHRDVMGPAFIPEAVHATFGPSDGANHYFEALGCRIVFAQPRNQFIFSAKWLDGAAQLGDELSYASVLILCDAIRNRMRRLIGVAGKVREHLQPTLGRRAGLDEVASHFGMPVRTMRRKLRQEGTTFRELLDQLRAEVATMYLRDTELTTEGIAHALGFEDATNFRNAFRRWNGMSPREFRRVLRSTRDD